MPENQKICEEDAVRLDHFLTKVLQCSRNEVQRLIHNGNVEVEGKQRKPSYRVLRGQRVEWHINSVVKEVNKVEDVQLYLDVIYEDSALLVINKQAGIVVHEGDIPSKDVTLVDMLHAQNIPLYDGGLNHRPGIVHRLDRMTEGLMVIAKTKEAFNGLIDQFKNRGVTKWYYTLLHGDLKHASLTIDQPIGRQGSRGVKQAVIHSGKQAQTTFNVIKRFNSVTMCQVVPKTGRTHQIRVHARFMGHPVVGDALYGVLGRHSGQLLQAYFLSFIHPCLQIKMSFSIPVSKRLRRFYG